MAIFYGIVVLLLMEGVNGNAADCSVLSCLDCVGGGHCQFCVGASEPCINSSAECSHVTTTVVVPANATDLCPAVMTTTSKPPTPESNTSFWVFWIVVPVVGVVGGFLIYGWAAPRIRRVRQQRRRVGGISTAIAYRQLETAIQERRVQMERHAISLDTPPVTADCELNGSEMPLFLPCPPKPPASPLLALSEDEIQSLFVEMDRDRDGLIDIADLRAVLRSIGGEVDDVELEWMIRDCAHVNGNMNFQAFRKKMLEIVADQDLV